MKQNGRYILFRLLLSLRGIVRIICKIVVFTCIIGVGALCIYDTWKHGLPLIIVAIIFYLFMIYYDKLLFKIKPDNTDLWVS